MELPRKSEIEFSYAYDKDPDLSQRTFVGDIFAFRVKVIDDDLVVELSFDSTFSQFL